MKNKDLAKKIYSDLNKRGAELGNASITIIKKTLDKELSVDSKVLIDFLQWYLKGDSIKHESVKELANRYVKENKYS